MKRYLMALLFLVTCISVPAYSVNDDKWNLSGEGVLYNKDMVTVDSNWNLKLRNGSITLGNGSVMPSTFSTTGAMYNIGITNPGQFGLKVPFVNVGTAVSTGSVIITTATNVNNYIGYGVAATVVATNTVIGVADGFYAQNATGYMTITGYTLVLTSGVVKPGDVLVSSSTLAGYAGPATSTGAANNFGFAKAVSFNNVAGFVLAIMMLR